MVEHNIGPYEISETPDGYLILDTRQNNSSHILHGYLNHIPPEAHRLLVNNVVSQMERFYLDGFKHLEVTVNYSAV
jgi:hypothetical protein